MLAWIWMCVCGDWICCSYISTGIGPVNNHGGGFNDTAVNLIASHLLGGLRSLWCSLAADLQHMGNYLQWAPSLGEFTDVHFPKRRGSLFFDLCHGDIMQRWFIVGAPPALFDIWCRELLVSAWWRISWFTQQLRAIFTVLASVNKDLRSHIEIQSKVPTQSRKASQ